MWLHHCYREQARSHIGAAADTKPIYTAKTCGSEPAREGASTSNITANCPTAIASRLAPTIESKYDCQSQVGYKAASLGF